MFVAKKREMRSLFLKLSIVLIVSTVVSFVLLRWVFVGISLLTACLFGFGLGLFYVIIDFGKWLRFRQLSSATFQYPFSLFLPQVILMFMAIAFGPVLSYLIAGLF